MRVRRNADEHVELNPTMRLGRCLPLNIGFLSDSCPFVIRCRCTFGCEAVGSNLRMGSLLAAKY